MVALSNASRLAIAGIDSHLEGFPARGPLTANAVARPAPGRVLTQAERGGAV